MSESESLADTTDATDAVVSPPATATVSFEVHQAVLSEAIAISTFGKKSFTHTFGHLYPEEDLNTHLNSFSTEAFEAYIADPSGKYRLYVACSNLDGTVGGYVLAGPCDLPHKEASGLNGEIKKLYIDVPYFGSGMAKALMDRGLQFLRETFPQQPVYIGVWSENYRAQRFYMEKYPFEKVGEYEYVVGRCRDREFILREKVYEQ